MKTDVEKTENEIIAEFMGAVESRDSGVCGIRTYWLNEKDPSPLEDRDMYYKISWDWLMPVVEKIESTRVEIPPYNLGYEFDCDITGSHVIIESVVRPTGQKNVRFTKVEGTKIESTYKAVVEFIHWYNSQLPQQENSK